VFEIEGQDSMDGFIGAKHQMHAPTSAMAWLRVVDSLKLYVSFVEYSPFYRALLQKRLMILRSLLIVAPLYHQLQPLSDFGGGVLQMKEGPLVFLTQSQQ